MASGHIQDLESLQCFILIKEKVVLSNDNDFPINVDIQTASLETGFSYSCKEGEFHNHLDKSIKEGINCGGRAIQTTVMDCLYSTHWC